ncbi:hypothetical protein GGS24DRAFT_509472 [Hypoxylon argillaceum]|nr:hypothetical protein GGS24DRAFT_509472 [Hypoxylon argillaceum]
MRFTSKFAALVAFLYCGAAIATPINKAGPSGQLNHVANRDTDGPVSYYKRDTDGPVSYYKRDTDGPVSYYKRDSDGPEGYYDHGSDLIPPYYKRDSAGPETY